MESEFSTPLSASPGRPPLPPGRGPEPRVLSYQYSPLANESPADGMVPLFDSTPEASSQPNEEFGGMSVVVINSDSPISEINKQTRRKEMDAQSLLDKFQSKLCAVAGNMRQVSADGGDLLVLDTSTYSYRFTSAGLAMWISKKFKAGNCK